VFIPSMVWNSRILARLSGGRVDTAASKLEQVTVEVTSRMSPRGSKGARALRLLSGALILALLYVILIWNFTTLLNDQVRRELQRPLRPVVNATVIRQHWNMFSHPEMTDAWLVYAARLRDGQEVDLIQQGAAVSFAKPSDSSDLFPNHRWRKMHALLDSNRFQRYRRNVADFHIQQWNASHPPAKQIITVKLYRVFERRDSDNPAQTGVKLFETITVK
jgi:hypothetical protein